MRLLRAASFLNCSATASSPPARVAVARARPVPEALAAGQLPLARYCSAAANIASLASPSACSKSSATAQPFTPVAPLPAGTKPSA